MNTILTAILTSLLAATPAFEVASIRPNNNPDRSGIIKPTPAGSRTIGSRFRVPIDQLRLMLRNLLVDRFHLAVHFEKRDLPVFALVVAKGGPKQLHNPAANVEKHMELASTDAQGQRWQFYNSPLASLAGFISTPTLGRPVLDMTGINGAFDFTFVMPVWNRADGPLADHVVEEVFPELQSQLGLRVEAQTAPLDVLVIDRLDRTPTEN